MNLADTAAQLVMVGTRVSALMVFAPLFNSSSIAPRIKVGLTFAITAAIVGAQPLRTAATVSALALGGELVAGLVLGLTVNFVFEAAQLAGQILGFQFGFSLVNVIDPQTQVDSPVLSVFHQTITILIFLQLDVHHWILRGVARSFQYFPVGSLTLAPVMVRGLLQASAGLWLAGVQMAAPALAATMLADVAIGLLGKASPQLPLMFVQIPVKAVLGMLAVAASLAYWPSLLERKFAVAIGFSERLLGLGS